MGPLQTTGESYSENGSSGIHISVPHVLGLRTHRGGGEGGVGLASTAANEIKNKQTNKQNKNKKTKTKLNKTEQNKE